jgi:hypothetical protein
MRLEVVQEAKTCRAHQVDAEVAQGTIEEMATAGVSDCKGSMEEESMQVVVVA